MVQTRHGNLLWDCISLIDEATKEAVRALGGISAIAISHPHYYSSMVEWSESFGNVPIYIHGDDRRWVMRRSPNIVFWRGEQERLFGNLTLIRCGGHFEGGTVLHWADGEKRSESSPGRRRVYPEILQKLAKAVALRIEKVVPGCGSPRWWWGTLLDSPSLDSCFLPSAQICHWRHLEVKRRARTASVCEGSG